MMELGMGLVLVGMGIYFYKSSDLPTHLKEGRKRRRSFQGDRAALIRREIEKLQAELNRNV